ncbi:hypothetical protein [Deinococcus cellulosilyticus]|uniref:Uncharacterized protein n=1 Tax=Deinococcus cellulosilyticus (strain DSM 18568 / NBRC 106333 / KACC 11606 / 5516J-15) TaxID=1223518 RepID=A0A511N796_DEIC1|nr:hypothetical protein [Deinococcus cellulosilyticus]GEM48723.1 hypothetical protein DC3_43580 [Deinococcus cellulosilyticus NBRC 106333 = KACC 11606]
MANMVEVVKHHGPWAHVAISYLKERGGDKDFVDVSASEMARQFEVAITTISRPLQSLIQEGIIEVQGRSRGTKYRVTEKLQD